MNTTKESPPRIRILIVEDRGMVRAFREHWLADQPRYTLVVSARPGEEALMQVEAARPDVALVDFQLPGMDGLEFVQAARQMRPQLRALVVTSLVDALTLTRVREAGVEGYVEKDATPEVLTAALEAVTDGRSFYSGKFRETIARGREVAGRGEDFIAARAAGAGLCARQENQPRDRGADGAEPAHGGVSPVESHDEARRHEPGGADAQRPGARVGVSDGG